MSDEIPEEIIDECFDAAEAGNVAAVQSTMEQFPDLWNDDRFVLNITGDAAEGGHVDILKLFESQLRANVLVVDATPLESCLCNAAEHGNLNVVEYLLDCGANANANGMHVKEFTVLHEAIDNGHFDIAERLLAAGAEFPVHTISSNALLQAVHADNADLVKWLLDHKFDPHVIYRNYDGLLCNVLSFALPDSDAPITRLLLDAGCRLPVEGQDLPLVDFAVQLYQRVRKESEFRGFFDAIRADDADAVRDFRTRNPFLWEKGNFGMDAWDCAARSGNVNAGRAIMEKDKSVDFPDPDLHRFGVVLTAIRNGHIPFAEMMIGTVCEFRTHAAQFNPIFVAINSRQHEVLEWLLAKEVNPHLEYRFSDGRRMNAITYAQELGDTESIEILSAAGCRPPKKLSLKKQELDDDSDESMIVLTPQIQCALALHDRLPEHAIAMLRENGALRDDEELQLRLIKFAAKTGQISFMRELADSIRGRDSLMTEWFYWATKEGHIEVLQFLVDCGVDPAYDNGDSFPQGAMRTAVGNGHLDIAQWLHGLGVPLSTASIRDNILFEAIAQERADIVRWLLTTDLDPHVTYETKSGKLVNALSRAESNDERAMVRMLRAAGCASPKAADDDQ